MLRCAARWAILLLVPAVMFAQHRSGRSNSMPPGPSASPDFKDVVATFGGVLKNMTKKEITLDLDDSHELMTFRRTKETKFTNDGAQVKATLIDLEMHVTIDAKQDPDSKLRAVAVRAGKEPKPAEESKSAAK
jgi:hypothetical protein